jgi:hypothetical protein
MKLNPFTFLSLFAVLNAGCGDSGSPSSPAGAAGVGGGSSGASGSGGAAGSAGSAATGGAGAAGGPATGTGTVNGSFMGNAFTTIASSWWIGKPATGSAPTQIYLSDATLACADLATAGWDKLLGTKQLMEFDLAGEAPKKYEILVDMDASYVREPYNPSAEAGSVTITDVTSGKNIVGSYDLTFAGDNVKGTFDAAFCAEGVEP